MAFIFDLTSLSKSPNGFYKATGLGEEGKHEPDFYSDDNAFFPKVYWTLTTKPQRHKGGIFYYFLVKE
jgi:hypothetical protein